MAVFRELNIVAKLGETGHTTTFLYSRHDSHNTLVKNIRDAYRATPSTVMTIFVERLAGSAQTPELCQISPEAVAGGIKDYLSSNDESDLPVTLVNGHLSLVCKFSDANDCGSAKRKVKGKGETKPWMRYAMECMLENIVLDKDGVPILATQKCSTAGA